MTKQLSLEQITACGISQETAAIMLPQINQWLSSLPAAKCWQQLTHQILKPNQPFHFHELLYQTTFADWQTGQPPAWFPSNEQIQSTNIAALMKQLNVNSYPELHAWSTQHRDEFWEITIQRLGIRFQKPYSKIVDLSQGVESPQWLVDGRLNIAESCFLADENATAIIFQQEGGSLSTLTYGELHRLTNRVANGLVQAGFVTGDAIAIALPMTVESVAIYLGIVKAGCVVVSIADSFAPAEIAMRLHLAQAKAIFTQDYVWRCGKQLPLYSKVVDANAPRAIVLGSSVELRTGDVTWTEFLSQNEQFDAVISHPAAHTNILFSSGTTGIPKAIPWTQTTPIKCAVDGHLHQDIHPGDVVAWPTNLGWMMGPWLIYASLINQATIALYYDTPTERGFGEFIQNARVNILGVVPSLVSTWKTTACMQELDWSSIKAYSSTGECSNPQDMLFLMSQAGYKPIIEYCGGTEIGGAYLTNTVVQPSAPSTFTTPALGLDLAIFNEAGHPSDKGEVFIIAPSVGLSTEIINKDHHQVYFAHTPHSSLRRHGDQIERLSNGYYRTHGRVDDTMNLGGIKVSSMEIEQILNNVEGICEAIAIAYSPPEGGPSQLIVYAVLESHIQLNKELLKNSLQTAIRQQLNPLFKIQHLVIIDTLPRTASNKVMRRILREDYHEAKHKHD
ncbi:AMP-binding protein [Calothrix sp. FACHB-1219]|uniref:AMP-binding protein n=1 Tax=unclassified Calothrix TaxID=2619626 RepID=UPI001687570A|nr:MULTISPECIES: AMP-binding protein [unclassified Calothrix]MBD2206652.1 AMP-binding protein [Calothrix sp. FACHB-168]MBD2219251.1 AMP-binding protein [Calothrix sp. FACHB-1219]